MEADLVRALRSASEEISAALTSGLRQSTLSAAESPVTVSAAQ